MEGYTCVHAVEWDVINVKTSVLYVFPLYKFMFMNEKKLIKKSKEKE